MPSKHKKASPKIFGLPEPKWLLKIHVPDWVVVVLALIFVFRIPSLFEPFYYSNEMTYLSLGQAIKRGMVLYRDIHDNKPPLIYFIASLAGNVFWFRAILAGWMMVTTAVFYKLVNHLFPKNTAVVKTAVIAFAILTTLPLLEGQITNTELFAIGPVVYAFYVLLSKKKTHRNLLCAGVLFSISVLFKATSVFDIGAIVLFWVITAELNSKNLFKIFKNLLVIFAGFMTPILLTIAWYYSRGGLNEYLVAAFLQNINYLPSFNLSGTTDTFLARNIPLLTRAVIVVAGSTILYIFRRKLSKPFMFTCLWLLFALFAATLSEGAYPHFILQVVPAISILIGMLIALPSIEQSLTIIPLLLVVLALIKFQFIQYSSLSYYQNFIEFGVGKKTKWQYFNYFSKNTERNYKISKYLVVSSKRDDKIFVWGEDSPVVYALSGRLPHIKYVANHHILDFSDPKNIIKSLRANSPKYVIILQNSKPFSALNSFLRNNYLFVEKIEGASVWKSMSPTLSKLLR